MPLQAGPCAPWPVDFDCTSCKSLLPDESPPDSPGNGPDVPALIERWSMVATEILFNLSGRRWGPCPVTVRPCRRSCVEQLGIVDRWGHGAIAGRWVPYTMGGRWYNASVCGCGADCHCGSELCEVYLPGPVHSIVEVTIEGEPIDPDTYRVDAAGMLVRQHTGDHSPGDFPGESPGEACGCGGGHAGCWPSCQDLSAPAGDPGTFAVTYNWGLPLTAGAVAAVSELTCEFLKACDLLGKDCQCRLPGNVRRVVRQGVQVDMSDPTTIFAEGRTGLPLVDLWLSTVNPNRLLAPPKVYSPDLKRPRVQTWP